MWMEILVARDTFPPELFYTMSKLTGMDRAPSDIWALVCGLVYMLDPSSFPKPAEDPKKLFLPALSEKVTASTEVRDLIEKMLIKDRKLRPTIDVVASHPWFGEGGAAAAANPDNPIHHRVKSITSSLGRKM